ncbi:MAG TPA: glutathione S-transferase family protein [Oligoflexus sp.]|uniref:glutathione S-transferase family protein n=1 Tax=Oligoflexus sp. TaxID=1971216 RepID=UPI002D74EDC7|nr:glutathione S-transferase family protein [Oligoflexus sp.]HYX39579.1 glutathione S-transferase family protein [Oligoflexus sp.]
MSLALYLHPLASFCHKVLLALYENGTPFESRIVDLMNDEASARYLNIWQVGKIPVLRDESRNQTIPETSIIIEYLEQHYPGSRPLLPKDEAVRLDARLWDRFFDLYVQVPMQKIVIDRLRPEDGHDPLGVAEARDTLKTAYRMIEQRMSDKVWAVGESFSLADCAAAPALFFANIVEPFSSTHPNLAAYFERLLARPSFQRVLTEARPYFPMFPYREAMQARFL